MWARVRTAVRERPIAGFGVSLVIHLALAALILLIAAPKPVYVTRRGEPLFVELPNLDEPAPRGNPAARTPGPPAAPVPAAPPRGDRSRPAPKPAPRASARAEGPARPAVPKPPVPPPKAAPAPTPSTPAPEAPKVAREPVPAPPTPAPAKPEASTPSAPEPAPAPKEPATKSAETERRPEVPKVAEAPRPPADTGAAAPEGGANARGRQMVMVPPGTPGSREGREGGGVDIRSALRRGGAGSPGGTADGRGGIEGEPIPLETKDPRYSDYLERVRRMIKEKWGFPCVREGNGRECEYKTAQLVVEFGIAKDGKVPFVNVRHSTGYDIMDEYAVRAVKLASPFPPVPDSLSRKGIPILATFNYIVDTSLVNLLR